MLFYYGTPWAFHNYSIGNYKRMLDILGAYIPLHARQGSVQEESLVLFLLFHYHFPRSSPTISPLTKAVKICQKMKIKQNCVLFETKQIIGPFKNRYTDPYH